MKCVIRTNNLATINFAEAVLNEVDIPYHVMDVHMSAMEGMIGAFPRRLMVLDEDEFAARRALGLAGLDDELIKQK